jgi:protein-tyrosine phosphatase
VNEGFFPVDRLPVSFHHHPLMRSVGDNNDFSVAPGFLATTYLEMADESHGEIAQVLRLLSHGDNAPAVFHCTAGKDRTGVTAAVLLSLLGCSRETVVADYTESHAAMDALRLKLAAKYPAAKDTIMAADDLFSADAVSIELFLDHLITRHGSVLGFAHFAGLTDDDVDRLQQNLLEG